MNSITGIKNIIFDFGGVLIDLDRERCLRAFEKLGVDARSYLGQYAQGGIFSRIETGSATVAEFYDDIRELSGQTSLTDEQICQAWNRFLLTIPAERLDALERLKGRYRLFLLSNTNVLHWDISEREHFTVCGHTADYYFERLFLSYEMGLTKPDPEIFVRAVADAGIRADESLFIDDSKDNCAAAESTGLHTFRSVEGGDWMKLFE